MSDVQTPEDPFFSEEQTALRKARLDKLVAEVQESYTRPSPFVEHFSKYSLFEDVLDQIHHRDLTRPEQHAQLERILRFSRQGGNPQ